MNPLVSIIIPVYESEPYLEKCLDSVLAQTMTNIEIIAINDGSPDNSIAILNEYKKRDIRIKVISIENSGVSRARNIGLRNSCGKYVVFIDSDDWIEADMVERLYNACENTNCKISKCDCFFEKKGDTVEITYQKKDIEIFSVDRALKELFTDLSEKHFGYMCNKMYSKKFLDDLNLELNEELRYSEDVLFFVQAVLEAKSIAYVPSQLYHYYLGNESATRGYIIDMKQQQFILYDAILNELKNYNMLERVLPYISYYILLGLGHLNRNELFKCNNIVVGCFRTAKITKEFNKQFIKNDLKIFPSMLNRRMYVIHFIIKYRLYFVAGFFFVLENLLIKYKRA